MNPPTQSQISHSASKEFYCYPNNSTHWYASSPSLYVCLDDATSPQMFSTPNGNPHSCYLLQKLGVTLPATARCEYYGRSRPQESHAHPMRATNLISTFLFSSLFLLLPLTWKKTTHSLVFHQRRRTSGKLSLYFSSTQKKTTHNENSRVRGERRYFAYENLFHQKSNKLIIFALGMEK